MIEDSCPFGSSRSVGPVTPMAPTATPRYRHDRGDPGLADDGLLILHGEPHAFDLPEVRLHAVRGGKGLA